MFQSTDISVIPEIPATKLLLGFYRHFRWANASRTDYEGEIRELGDSVQMRYALERGGHRLGITYQLFFSVFVEDNFREFDWLDDVTFELCDKADKMIMGRNPDANAEATNFFAARVDHPEFVESPFDRGPLFRGNILFGFDSIKGSAPALPEKAKPKPSQCPGCGAHPEPGGDPNSCKYCNRSKGEL